MLEQLRKGNTVIAGGEPVKVQSISVNGVFDNKGKFHLENKIGPAPITQQGLEEIGFLVNGIAIMHGSMIYLFKPGKPGASFALGYIGKGVIAWVKYLHTVQNFVFLLSNPDK